MGNFNKSTAVQSCTIGHVKNKTAFKIVAYYEKKPNGEYYSAYEIATKQNRKYHDSFDYYTTRDSITVTRHDEAYKKQDKFFAENIHNMFSALQFAIIEGKEYCIRKIVHKKLVAIVEPHFYIGKQKDSIILWGLKGEAIKLGGNK